MERPDASDARRPDALRPEGAGCCPPNANGAGFSAETGQAPHQDPLTALTEILPVGVFTIGSDMRVRRMNPAAARLLGVDPRGVVGKPCEEVFHCSFCGKARCAPEEALETGEVRRGFTAELRPGEGAALDVQIDAVPLAGGEVAVVLSDARSPAPEEPDERMKDALRRAAGSVTHAARLLGVHRTTLWRWMGAAGLRREEFFPH